MKKHLLLVLALLIFGLSANAQTILGVDVSHYDSDNPYGAENWTQVKTTAGKTFAWNKATQGVTYTDPSFVTNMVNGHAAGVVMGAYHFADCETNTAVAEANYFVSVAGPYIGPGYLPPVLDLEDPTTGPALSTAFTSAALTTWVQTWMTTVQNATGVAPIIYTDGNYAGYLNSSLNTYGLWIANPGTSPTTPPTTTGSWTTWAFKQYSWTGTVAGIGSNSSAQVDLDVFNGTLTAFNTLIGGDPVTPNFTANARTGCQGMAVTFTDQSTSTGTITGHNWTFTGGTPPTSNAQNPTVTYNSSGNYNVKEVVTSTTGVDSVTMTAYIHVIPTSSLPLVETFQSSTFPPTGWTMNYQNAGDSAWELCPTNGYNSSQCMYFPANCGYVHNISGERQQIYTPDYSFAATTNPEMWFDVAYEPYDRRFSDTLAIYSSTDCGNTWNLIYLKGGMTLCTTGSTDSAGVDTSGGNGCFIPPNAQAWRTDSINLATLAGNTSVMFSFESRSGWGNILYLDNINVADISVTCTTPATPTIQASPGTTNCGAIQLTATSSGCSNCTYNWSNSSTGSTISVNSTGTYHVTAVNGNCTSSPASVSVTVNQAPTVSAGASSQQVCINQSVTLTATGNATSYQWSGTGLQTNTGSSVNAIVSTSGNQPYTVTATLNSCTATASTTINFNTSVVPTISISQTTANPICTGSQVTFSATETNGGLSPVYQWTSSSNQTGNGNNFTLNNAANGTTVRCLLISNAGCASPDSVYSNILTISTQALQPVTLSIATPDTNVCSGENIAFTSSSTNGGNSPSYNWYVNGSSSGSGSTYTLNNIQSNSTVYCVMASSASCVTGSPVTSNSMNIHIQLSAQATVSISASSTTICAGTLVTFTATPGNGGNSPVYAWQVNGNAVGSNSSTYTSSNLQNSDAVSCSMTSSASCVSNPNVVSNTETMQVNPLPIADAGATVYMPTSSSSTIGGNPSANGGTAPYTYLWSPATWLNSTVTSNPLVSGITTNTLYTLVVTDSKGCTATDTVGVYLINCNLSAPTVQLNLCDLAAQNLPAVAYQWYLQGSMITGATTRFYSVSQSGYYFVKVNDTAGCTAQSPDVFVNYPTCLTTGIEAISDHPEFEIYPNPANGEITVSCTNTIEGNAHIEIFDLTGQTIYRSNSINAATGFKYTIYTGNLATGAYLIKVTNEDGKFAVKRLIKL